MMMQDNDIGVIREDLAWARLLDTAWERVFLLEANGDPGVQVRDLVDGEIARFGAVLDRHGGRVTAVFPDRGSLAWFRLVWG